MVLFASLKKEVEIATWASFAELQILTFRISACHLRLYLYKTNVVISANENSSGSHHASGKWLLLILFDT